MYLRLFQNISTNRSRAKQKNLTFETNQLVNIMFNGFNHMDVDESRKELQTQKTETLQFYFDS